MVDQTVPKEPSSTESLDARLSAPLSISAQDLIAEVMERCQVPLPEGAFTFKQFVTRTGECESAARRILKSQVASGLLLTKLTHSRKCPRFRIWWRNPDFDKPRFSTIIDA